MLKPPSSTLRGFFRRSMNCAIQLQQIADVDDGQGGTTRDWATFDTDIAAIQPLTGAERLAEGGPDATATHRLILGYRSDVGVTHRILYGTRIFEIQSTNDYATQGLLLECIAQERFVK